jgi:hypothetical protein
MLATLLIGALGTRLLYYSPLVLGEGLQGVLEGVLAGLTFFTVLTLVVMPVLLIFFILSLAFLVFKPRSFFQRDPAGWRSQPWLFVSLCLAAALGQGFYDVNPRVAIFCLLTLPLVLEPLWDALYRIIPSPRPFLVVMVWSVPLASALVMAGDRADRLSSLVWLAVLALLSHLAPRYLVPSDRLVVAVLLIPLSQILAAVLPASVTHHGGKKLGDGMAYSFCESPSRERLFAALPSCGTAKPWMEKCRKGHVAVYDLQTLSPQTPLRFFSDNFYGRLEQILCLENEVQIGMNRTLMEGRFFLENAMSFHMDEPSQMTPSILGEEGGHRVHYHPATDALFYLGDDVPLLVKRDRKTGRDTWLRNKGPSRQRMVNGSIHSARNSLYTVSIDAPIQEVDLTSLDVKSFLDHAGGTELTADEEKDRLYVATFWGLLVYDLNTGQLILRKRLGMIVRQPLIDSRRDLLYVPTFGEGKIRVLDRSSLESLGTIPIGLGTRYPYLSSDGSRFFATSDKAHFYWDASELARTFRGY